MDEPNLDSANRNGLQQLMTPGVFGAYSFAFRSQQEKSLNDPKQYHYYRNQARKFTWDDIR